MHVLLTTFCMSRVFKCVKFVELGTYLTKGHLISLCEKWHVVWAHYNFIGVFAYAQLNLTVWWPLKHFAF